MNLEEALTEIEKWKDACGLECGGDPDDVTPEAAAEYWENIERIAQQRDDAVNSYLNCRQDLEYCKQHAHQSAAYICSFVAKDLERECASKKAEGAWMCAQRLRDSTPDGWPGARISWTHTNEADELPRVEARPEHQTRPHITVQEPDIDDFEYCIAEFSVGFRDDLPECSHCGGVMRCHGIGGDYDCPWCDAQGVSVMDEAMKMANWVYSQWLTTRTEKDSTRLTDESVNSGSCNDGKLHENREQG
jgi:hypothetical protein